MPAKNPATLFLNLAAGNVAISIVFVVIYFIYVSKGGDRSYLLLIAAGVAFVAAIGSVIAYFHFNHKIMQLIDRELDEQHLEHPADRARRESIGDQ